MMAVYGVTLRAQWGMLGNRFGHVIYLLWFSIRRHRLSLLLVACIRVEIRADLFC